MSFFKDLEQMPEDPIFGLQASYTADQRDKKVNLGIGTYKDGEGLPVVLSCVKKAEAMLLDQNLNKEYLPIVGDPEYMKGTLELIFGENHTSSWGKKIFTAQTIGGTSALRIGAEFLAEDPDRMIFISEPTWPIHKPIFKKAGMKVATYPYYDNVRHQLDFEKIRDALSKIPAGSVILLHACCHNPTGMDPTFEQWKEISDLILKNKIIPFFDFAYQGFGDGMEEDARPIRYFLEQGHEMLVAYSYSKNMGLYGERLGMFALNVNDVETATKAGSHVKQIIRYMYSNPHLGERIVSKILLSPFLKKEWDDQLASMRHRIRKMRETFVADMHSKGSPSDFSFIDKQKGLFSLSGLDQDQVAWLRKEFGVYIPSNGRINMAGLSLKNMDDVTDAFLSALKSCTKTSVG